MAIDSNILNVSFSFVEVLGKALRVQTLLHPEGKNKPFLVFLHEGLGAIELWKGFPEMLSTALKANAIVYERQGYGQSAPLDLPRPKDYLEREALDYLPVLLEKLNIEKPILIGHSDGGSIALVYAGRYACSALITEAAHIFVEPVTLAGIEAVKDNPQLDIIKQKLSKYHGSKTEAIFSAWADTWLSPGFRDWNISNYLEGICCPALIIQGLYDEYASALQVEKILEAMPNSPFKKQFMPEKCAHIPHLQAQKEVLEEMIIFLTEIESLQ